jgi:ATP-dependent Zn protease
VENKLTEKKADLEKLAEALLEHETLDAQEIDTLLKKTVTTPE